MLDSMGAFCSSRAMEENDSVDDDHHHHHHHQQHDRDQSRPQTPPRANNHSNKNQHNGFASGGDGDGDETAAVPPPAAASPTTARSKRRIAAAASLFRVGSSRKTGNGGDGGAPNSPRRATNYDHVHHAVAVNFRQALLATGGGAGGSSGAGAGSSSEGDSGAARQNSKPLGLIGIRNLGNTCYLNSSLQCLSATIPLTDYFLGYEYRSEINSKNPLGTQGKLAVEYAELMKEMWLGKNSVVKPVSFKSQLESFAPQFRGRLQQDCQELLAYLLDGIHEDLNRIEQKPYIEDRDCDGSQDAQDAIEAWRNYLRRDKSLIVDIFQGQLRSKLTCLKCKHSNVRFEPFMYLSLPISSSCRTVQDCLDLYLEREKMTGANQWYCGKCKKHRNATKKTDLWILPPILIVHLKRFSFDDYGQLGSKNQAPIRYPVEGWDLSRVVRSRAGEHPLYDLYAVSNHVGGLGGGHYTAYTQNRFNDQWYEHNDSTYRPIVGNVEEVHRRNSSSAYVLFYNRSQADKSSVTSGFSEQDAGSTASEGRVPLIRRQSVNRPDLWPHAQVRDSQFREFSRLSTRKLLLPLPPLESAASAESKEDSDEGIEATDDRVVDAKVKGAVHVTSSAKVDASEGSPSQRRKSKPSRFL